MNRSTKVIIGIVVTVVIIWGGYLLIRVTNNSQTSSDIHGGSAQTGGMMQSHLDRALEHFGL